MSYCSSLRCRFWLSSQSVCVFHSNASIEFQYFNEKKKKNQEKPSWQFENIAIEYCDRARWCVHAKSL